MGECGVIAPGAARRALAPSGTDAPLNLVSMYALMTAARRVGEQYEAASKRLYAATSDHLNSLKMARGYGAERRHADRFAQLSRELASSSRASTNASALTRQWVATRSAVMLATIVYLAQAVVKMSPAALFLLIFLFARLVPRVLDALPFGRAIECRHVTFSYRDATDPPALQDVTLTINAHATTAIVGPSGAGNRVRGTANDVGASPLQVGCPRHTRCSRCGASTSTASGPATAWTRYPGASTARRAA